MLLYLARHAETVYNAGARMQGHMAHTPLTRAGIAQAEAMGAALSRHFGPGADHRHLGLASRTHAADGGDRRRAPGARLLRHPYRRAPARNRRRRMAGAALRRHRRRAGADHLPRRARLQRAARRAANIIRQSPPACRRGSPTSNPDRTALVISHGITLRVLRGLLAGGRAFEGVTLADDAPQGTVFRIEDGVERALHMGAGHAGAGGA